VPLVGGIN